MNLFNAKQDFHIAMFILAFFHCFLLTKGMAIYFAIR